MYAPPSRPRVPALLIAAVLVSGFACAIVRPAHAQAGGPTWMPFDAAPPGTPAEVLFDHANSSASHTALILVMHGFWVTPRVGPGGAAFSEIEVPGLQRLAITGAPGIPILRHSLAIVTNSQVALAGMTPQAPAMHFSLHLWPQSIPARDDDTGFGTPEVFVQDPAIYASGTPYPASQGMASPLHTALGSIRASDIECYPIRWTPSTDDLEVFPITRWDFSHDGPQLAFDFITPDRNRIASHQFLNWDSSVAWIPPSFLHYQGEYLFIYPSAYAAAIKPLVTQKYMRGWNVTTMTTESIGSISCASVRAAIHTWYTSTPSSHDHDCVLVGDLNNIPYCGDPINSDPRSDDPYGSINSTDMTTLMERDIFVGRLPGFTAADISAQVTKIINYEDHPPGPLYYGDVLLVAHKIDATTGVGDYPAQQEVTRTRGYKVNPLFVPYYGSQAGKNDAGVNNQINNGYGIVCYRGHGWTHAWTTWDLSGSCSGYTDPGECYTATNINALTNSPLNPILWSIACDNADLTDGNCIARAWMTKTPGGAVAHYGATRGSGTQDNNVLEDSLFVAVWTYGITNIAHATTYAEDRNIVFSWGAGPDNAFEYTLFGDPDMNIRRDKPPSWQTIVPVSITLLGSGQSSLDIQLLDGQGAPVQAALVGVFKPGAGFGASAEPAAGSKLGARPATSAPPTEVLDNTYTDATGHAHFLISPQTPGFLYYTVRDSGGGSVVDSIPVVGTASAGGGPVAVSGLWAAPSVTRGATTIHFARALDRGATLTVFDAAGRAVSSLPAPAGATAVAWSGTDASGAPVRSGLYFVRLDIAGERRLARIAVRR
jgi:hypothetical protein